MTELKHQDGRTLQRVLDDHLKWVRGEIGGVRADLSRANLSGADLTDVNLSDADLTDANLSRANLSGANLSRANLYGAYLTDANLSRANLSDAYLSRANLSRADLSGANLSDANLSRANLSDAYLSRANLSGANLLCSGDMRYIKTMQLDTWPIGYTHDTLQIGCQRHEIKKWRKWDTPAGRRWIANMDDGAAEWADRLLPIVLQIIDASPAEKSE